MSYVAAKNFVVHRKLLVRMREEREDKYRFYKVFFINVYIEKILKTIKSSLSSLITIPWRIYSRLCKPSRLRIVILL